MRLAPRLLLAFGAVAVICIGGLGFWLREDRRARETSRFDEEVKGACSRVAGEIVSQADRDQKLMKGACQSGALVDRTLIAIESGELADRRIGLAALVPAEREAFDLDELMLVTEHGEVLGADPRALFSQPADAVIARLSHGNAVFRILPKQRAIAVGCTRTQGRRSASLLGIRRVESLLARVARTANVTASISNSAAPSPTQSTAVCHVADASGTKMSIAVATSTTALAEQLRRLDERVFIAAMIALGLALAVATILARSLGRPLALLANEARKVALGEAKPIAARGGGEIAELVSAYNRMIDDLQSARRRLAFVSRVAAWREVAKRVAHEVKNPLAPIRAAVETLRRLRARQDPAFDGYFDEATATVLNEVQRISIIVTEFSQFARLPRPKLEWVDIAEAVRHVLVLNEAAAPKVKLELRLPPQLPKVMADRDQLVQVLLNLVGNAIDAVKGRPSPGVRIAVEHTGAQRYRIVVSDNGVGVPENVSSQLFEPHVTTKPQGAGLGLAIARRIAIEHGGDLWLAETGPAGSSFILELPIEPPLVSEGTDDA
jgi:signal transduction histidine kinase